MLVMERGVCMYGGTCGGVEGWAASVGSCGREEVDGYGQVGTKAVVEVCMFVMRGCVVCVCGGGGKSLKNM